MTNSLNEKLEDYLRLDTNINKLRTNLKAMNLTSQEAVQASASLKKFEEALARLGLLIDKDLDAMLASNIDTSTDEDY